MTNFEKRRESSGGSPDPLAGSAATPAPDGLTAPGGSATGRPTSASSSSASSTSPSSSAPTASTDRSAADDRPAPAGFDERGHVKRGRVSTLWISLIAAAVFLILLIIFIAQNQAKASIHFLGLSGHLATGLVVLIAAIIGVLLAAIPGTIRIVQLRSSLKRNTPKDERRR